MREASAAHPPPLLIKRAAQPRSTPGRRAGGEGLLRGADIGPGGLRGDRRHAGGGRRRVALAGAAPHARRRGRKGGPSERGSHVAKVPARWRRGDGGSGVAAARRRRGGKKRERREYGVAGGRGGGEAARRCRRGGADCCGVAGRCRAGGGASCPAASLRACGEAPSAAAYSEMQTLTRDASAKLAAAEGVAAAIPRPREAPAHVMASRSSYDAARPGSDAGTGSVMHMLRAIVFIVPQPHRPPRHRAIPPWGAASRARQSTSRRHD